MILAAAPFDPNGLIAPTVSAAAGVCALVGFLATWIIDQKSAPRLSMIFLVTGITGLLTAAFAQPVRHVIKFLDSYASGWSMHWLGVTIIGALMAVPLVYAGRAFLRHSIEDKHMIAAASLPIIIPLIPGFVGTIAAWLVYLPVNLIGWVFAKLFGLL